MLKRALSKQILSESRKGHLTTSEIERIMLCLLGLDSADMNERLQRCMRVYAKKILGMARNRALTEASIKVIFNDIIDNYT